MKLGKRRSDDDPAGEASAEGDGDAATSAVAHTWTAPVSDAAHDEPLEGELVEPQPAVDSEAVELVGDAAPAPGPPAPPIAVAMPDPLPPIAATPLAAEPAPGVVLPPPVPADPAADVLDAAADGHAPPNQLMDEVKVLAAERPEIVVGAAFAGGILAAMILRRLGN